MGAALAVRVLVAGAGLVLRREGEYELDEESVVVLALADVVWALHHFAYLPPRVKRGAVLNLD